jgi:DNA-directed RNA polymerase I subunit RPA1
MLSCYLFVFQNQKLVRQRLGTNQLDELVSQHSKKEKFQEKSSVAGSYAKDLPEALENKVQQFIGGLSKEKRQSLQLKNQNKFLNMMGLKYVSSLAQPGEAVGVIAGQSIGEPSTQMTYVFCLFSVFQSCFLWSLSVSYNVL